MALTIYLVRHGETLFNRRDVIQGWVDSPLTAAGIEQARRAGDQLRARRLRAVYSSTSERAVDTAELIAEHHPGIPVIRRKQLREMHFGDLEAMPNSDFGVGRDVPGFFTQMYSGASPGVPGGETGQQYRDRIEDVFDEILRGHPDGGEVAVVSHGVTINAILVRAGWPTPGPLANASISIVRVPPEQDPFVVAVGLEDLTGHA